jgi:hypothetical protein
LVFAASGVTANFVAVAGRVLVRDSRLVGLAANVPSLDAAARALANWSANERR